MKMMSESVYLKTEQQDTLNVNNKEKLKNRALGSCEKSNKKFNIHIIGVSEGKEKEK